MMEGDFTWGGEHNTVYRWFVAGLCTWSLYNFVKQCHPNKFNKKEIIKNKSVKEV